MAERTPISAILAELQNSPEFGTWFETPPPWMSETSVNKPIEFSVGEYNFSMKMREAEGKQLTTINFPAQGELKKAPNLDEAVLPILRAAFPDQDPSPTPTMMLITDDKPRLFDLNYVISRFDFLDAFNEGSFSEVYFFVSENELKQGDNNLSSDFVYQFIPFDPDGPYEGVQMAVEDALNLSGQMTELLLKRHRNFKEVISETEITQLQDAVRQKAKLLNHIQPDA